MESEDFSFKLHELVKQNDIFEIVQLRKKHGAKIWQILMNKKNFKYTNFGTIFHWCVWYRHWKLLKFAVLSGGSKALKVRGKGSWMNNRTPREYAAHLDRACGHPFYYHAAKLKLIEKSIATTVELTVPLPAFHSFEGECADLGSRLYALVEDNCREGILAAKERFGEKLGSLKITNEKRFNHCTMGHWAIWLCHWDLLKFLKQQGLLCYETRGEGGGGGWTHQRTIVEFAEVLDKKCNHSYYEHVKNFLKHAGPPPKKSGVSEEEEEDKLCCVCMAERSTMACIPCGHLCACEKCSDLLKEQGASSRRCPICRKEIDRFQKIFVV